MWSGTAEIALDFNQIHLCYMHIEKSNILCIKNVISFLPISLNMY